MAMNVTLASMAPSQIKRNRYAMLNQFRRSLSVESEQITRSALYRRQSLLLNGTLLPDRTPCEKNFREPTPVTSSITKESTSFSRPLTSSSRPVTSDSRQRRNKGQRVTINVSGEKYQTYAETLDRFPKTLLGDAIRRDEFFEADENEYFFDRDRHAFAAIIHFYQSGGQVYCPLTVPLHILVSEIKYFELGQHALNQVLDTEDQTVNELPKNRLQREIWKLFEISESGIAANIVTVFSVIVIIFSVGILCIETLPYFKGYDPTMTQLNTYSRNNFPGYPPVRQPLFNSAHLPPFMRLNQSRTSYIRPVKHKTDAKAPNKTKPNLDWLKIFGLCETGIVAWFTLEFLVRFLSCPNKLQFMKSCMNIIDLLAIIPYYITLVFNEHGLGLDNIRIIRLVRVFRIFKLSRHSRGLQILGLTLKASIRELGLLIFFLLIGVILFSSAVYYIEMQTFQSIPDAFWWAIITMCTVGYGDKVIFISFHFYVFTPGKVINCIYIIAFQTILYKENIK